MVDQNEAYTFQKRGIFYFSKRVPSDLREFYKVSRLTYRHLIENVYQQLYINNCKRWDGLKSIVRATMTGQERATLISHGSDQAGV